MTVVTGGAGFTQEASFAALTVSQILRKDPHRSESSPHLCSSSNPARMTTTRTPPSAQPLGPAAHFNVQLFVANSTRDVGANFNKQKKNTDSLCATMYYGMNKICKFAAVFLCRKKMFLAHLKMQGAKSQV